MKTQLEILDLFGGIEGKEILKGLNLKVRQGETHTIMGPNGSGKSTLANIIMGHPKYRVFRGEILLDGEKLTHLPPDERARRGLFLSFQYPLEVPGVKLFNFLRAAYNGRRKENPLPVIDFHLMLQDKLTQLQMDPAFANRYLNDGLSGGEKKRCEIVQMTTLNPKIAILDETDSGLDIDALKVVADAVNRMRGPELGVLVITHYQRILRYIKPDFVHILMDGKVVLSGGAELAETLEEKGYDWVKKEGAA